LRFSGSDYIFPLHGSGRCFKKEYFNFGIFSNVFPEKCRVFNRFLLKDALEEGLAIHTQIILQLHYLRFRLY